MKKTLSLTLAAILAASALASCAPAPTATASASSDYADEAWLKARIGSIPDNVTVGTADELGLDMSAFEDDGYIIRCEDGETVVCGKTADGLDRAVRKYAKAYENGSVGDLNVTYHEGARIEKLTIAGRDISEYMIVMANNRDTVHEMAVYDLVDSIERATGITLEVTDTMGEHNIVLEQLSKEESEKRALGTDGFTISVSENGDLYISGAYYRGCLYGVYGFLETYLGWKYLYDFDLTTAYYDAKLPLVTYNDYIEPQMELIPEADAIDIPAGSTHTEVPSFAYRYLAHDPSATAWGHEQNDYFYKRRANGNTDVMKKGITRHASHGSLQYNYLFVDYDGDPNKNYCYSNEDNIAVTIEYYEEKISTMIASGSVIGEDDFFVDVAQSDSPDFCSCKSCMKLYNQDGYYTGAMLYYANAVAAAIAEDISPEIYVDMFAYWGTTEPPKVTKPLDNVSVTFCWQTETSVVGCMAHPLDGSECSGTKTEFAEKITNEGTADDLKKWCDVTTRVFIWYYPGTWAYLPFSTVTYKNVLADMKFFKECGVYGFYSSPSYPSPDDAVIEYVLPILTWNCDITGEEYDALVWEYLEAMYGDAADLVLEWMGIEERAQNQCCWSVKYFDRPTNKFDLTYYRDNFDKTVELFDLAISEAGSMREEQRLIQRAVYAYYPSLVTNYTPMFTNGTAEEKTIYLERWNFFEKHAKEFQIAFGDYQNKNKPIMEFDINTMHPVTLCVKDITDVQWYFNWEESQK